MTVPTRRPPQVVVMGVSGSGKSTVGRALARRLGVPFADADDLHPRSNIDKMSIGLPLDDDDRRPWLDMVGLWLARHDAVGGVMGCSALKRSYRQQLRTHNNRIVFIHLSGNRHVIRDRQGSRTGHFMPSTLLDSQFDDLEPLASGEAGVVIEIDQPLSAVIEDCVRGLLDPPPGAN